MTKRSLGWLLGGALAGCTPIYLQPDAGPVNELLQFDGAAKPALGVLASEHQPIGNPTGPCVVKIQNLVVSSTSPEASTSIVGSVYLNFASNTPNNAFPLLPFSQLAFEENGLQTGTPPLFGYALLQLPLTISLENYLDWLFPIADTRTNYLTVRVTDGITTLDLIWGLDLAACDPRVL